jgi:hypothetical protein
MHNGHPLLSSHAMDPPLPSSAHHDLTDYPQSEVESLSDSDWLDVSSSRESDDLESVGSDLEYRARSRRSSNSNGSSHDGLVEAWEGLADETPDDGLPADDDHTLATVFPVLPDDTISYPPLPTAEQPHVQTSDSEPADDEEKLKAALDQSMISTLSSSRSSSLGGMSHSRSTVHSTRDLRLSFPDPLTSSRNDLNQSYDDIITSDEAPFTTDNDDGPVSASPIPGSPTISEPKSPFLTDQADSAESVSHPHFSYLDRDFDIVLYGRSSPIKWQFAHDLLRKIQSNDAFPSTTPFEVTRPDPDRQLVRGFGSAFPKGVNITDRTGLSFAQDVCISYLALSLTRFHHPHSRIGHPRSSRPLLLSISQLPHSSFQSTAATCLCLRIALAGPVRSRGSWRGAAGAGSASQTRSSFLSPSRP